MITMPSVERDDPQQLIDALNSEEFFCLTKRGLKFMRLKTWKMFEDPLSWVRYLEKTNREYYIVDNTAKFKLRQASSKKVKVKKDEITLEAPKICDLFNFETAKRFPAQASNSKKSVDHPGCSKSSDEQSEEIYDEDDENVKNLFWSRKVLQKPVNVDLDILMDFIENRQDKNQSEQSKNEEGEESHSEEEETFEIPAKMPKLDKKAND